MYIYVSLPKARSMLNDDSLPSTIETQPNNDEQ